MKKSPITAIRNASESSRGVTLIAKDQSSESTRRYSLRRFSRAQRLRIFARAARVLAALLTSPPKRPSATAAGFFLRFLAIPLRIYTKRLVVSRASRLTARVLPLD